MSDIATAVNTMAAMIGQAAVRDFLQILRGENRIEDTPMAATIGGINIAIALELLESEPDTEPSNRAEENEKFLDQYVALLNVVVVATLSDKPSTPALWKAKEEADEARDLVLMRMMGWQT